jgi:DNA-binding NarL/FixJ family response regulator
MVVSADPLAASGLAALLATQPSVAVTGEATPDGGLRTAAQALAPDVAAFDVGPGDGHSEAVAGTIAAGVPVVGLLAAESQAREVLGAGARGLVLRSAPAARIAAALCAVAEGLWALDGAIGAGLLRPLSLEEPSERLTPREREFLALLAEGLSNRNIAERLGISERTAKFHAGSVLAKLGAENRAEAIVRAARLGLVTL